MQLTSGRNFVESDLLENFASNGHDDFPASAKSREGGWGLLVAPPHRHRDLADRGGSMELFRDSCRYN